MTTQIIRTTVALRSENGEIPWTKAYLACLSFLNGRKAHYGNTLDYPQVIAAMEGVAGNDPETVKRIQELREATGTPPWPNVGLAQLEPIGRVMRAVELFLFNHGAWLDRKNWRLNGPCPIYLSPNVLQIWPVITALKDVLEPASQLVLHNYDERYTQTDVMVRIQLFQANGMGNYVEQVWLNAERLSSQTWDQPEASFIYRRKH